jgi:hypothetical protein
MEPTETSTLLRGDAQDKARMHRLAAAHRRSLSGELRAAVDEHLARERAASAMSDRAADRDPTATR